MRRTPRAGAALAGLALLLMLSACMTLREQPAVYYVLGDGASPSASLARAQGASPRLLVAPTEVKSFYDTASIAFSRAPGTRGYYQYAFWTERPGQAFTRLLAARLEAAGAFSSVALSTSGVDGELMLNTTLTELYHDAAGAPGVARVRLTAELVDRRSRRLLARRTFDQAAPAASYDAPGAVAGFQRAIAALLDDLSRWVQEKAR
ncbi:ABC-type transport auxiliary lipoprotein family protein [Pelomicrobium sp. G1]|uniref:ABC-type transport auxiliary lipoprotein family protein n=1 Tax=unclassified Pelomicrobium TaxID=2815318 RepID=UPI00348E4D57